MNSTMKKKIVIGLMLVGSLAWAVKEQADKYGGQFPVWFNKGMYVGPNSPDPTSDTVHKVGRMLAGSATIDFASTTITCTDSSAITVTGAQVNDPCFVGMPTTLTGAGTGLNGSYTCYVSAANAVKVRHCAAGTADDPGSVIYEVRVISNNL